MLTSQEIISNVADKLSPLQPLINDLEEDKVYAYHSDGTKHNLNETQKEIVKDLENVHIRRQKVVAVIVTHETDCTSYVLISEYELQIGSPDYMMLCDKTGAHDYAGYNFWCLMDGWEKEYTSIGLRTTNDGNGIERVW